MSIDDDDFALLGLPRRFAMDRQQLDAAWKALQARVHPDRFAAEGAASQRVAMQWAVRANEAYQRLKNPLQRAAYLCELHGVPVASHSNTAMPPDFLVQQMGWRETLDEANAASEIRQLAALVDEEHARRMARLSASLDEQANAQQAAQEVRALMFIERLQEEIQDRLEQADSDA